MDRMITVGLDGSPESRAAAEWAAREAALRQVPVRLLHVWQPVPEPVVQAPLLGAETLQHWTERIPREAAEGLRRRHPGVEVTERSRLGSPAGHLIDAARDASLVVGRRIRRNPFGVHIGAVAHAVMHHATAPVAVVAHR
ncbi:universal stress protein [Streptomyces sp. BSE7F]|uniref:universal stress protein n=2 Tax=unclassified Streptomyces TaxID=2593676 RepID=UPI000C8845C8|nr:universal stress protein [Streptomyces sp. BSE7-9]MBJ6647933.1 universal stress protein [Streptomyces sp. BSE7-9]PWE12197.1 universal stress protein [Streptomyces sp. BSE7F]